MLPLVTVNILSFNRKEELRCTLRNVFAQEYKNIQVIVVDNHSSDGTTEMVGSEFPMVTLIALRKNAGIAGWNEGFRIAEGEFVLVLDDDSYPLNTTIARAAAYLQNESQCGVVACRIIQSGGSDPGRWKNQPKGIIDFIGCGAMMRTALVRQLGGFSSLIFLYTHELDFSIKVRDAGFRVDYCEEAPVVHHRSALHRNIITGAARDERFHYHFIRNWIIIACMHFPFTVIGFKVLRFIVGQMVFSALHGSLGSAVKSVGSGSAAVFRSLRSREVVSAETQSYFLDRGFMPGFFGDGVYGFARPKLFDRISFKKKIL